MQKQISNNQLLTACYHHVTYAFLEWIQTLKLLNAKGFLAQNRQDIWSLSDSNGKRTHNQSNLALFWIFYLRLQIFRKVSTFSFTDRAEGKSFTIRAIRSIYYLFVFYNAWMIFVRIGNIFDSLYVRFFKIDAKVFWFNTPAFFNNVSIITINQFSQSFFYGW